MSRRPHLSLIAAAVFAFALLLSACGDDEPATTTTTVTASEQSGEATTTAEGSSDPATPGASDQDLATGEAVASSDAAGSIPGDDSTVLGAQPSGSAAPQGSTGTTNAAPVPNPVQTDGQGILSRPFNSSSPWNTPISGASVDPGSGDLIDRAQLRVATVEQPNGRIERERRRAPTIGVTVNVTKWTVPVFSDTQPGAVQRIAVCRQFDCGPDAVSSVTIPENACPEPQYDGWMTVIESGSRTALDFWRGRCERDGSLSYHYVKRWDLDGPGFQQPTGVSARGSGLPLFAGLITPDEIRAGRIDHALAMSVPGAAERRYVQPASRTDGTGQRNSLPEGARIRLKPGAERELSETFVKNGMQRRVATTITSALQRYGAIIVDRSITPTMYAQRNANWRNVLPLNLIQDIELSNDFFEVVQLGPILFDPPRFGEAPALPPGTPTSIPGTTTGGGSPVTSGETGTEGQGSDSGTTGSEAGASEETP